MTTHHTTTTDIRVEAADRLAVLRRTLDWLEANPDRAIAYDMALDADDRQVNPDDPNAKCFCFAGRLCVEADVKLRRSDNGDFDLSPLRDWIVPLPTTVGALISCNDSAEDMEQRLVNLREYLDMLEKVCLK